MRHPTFFEQDIRLVGHRWSPRVHELKRFLGHSGVRFRWFDLDARGTRRAEQDPCRVGRGSTSLPMCSCPTAPC